MGVSNDHFKCNKLSYVQKDGMPMGASLAVILASLWLQNYEKVVAIDIPQKIDLLEDMNGKCPKFI